MSSSQKGESYLTPFLNTLSKKCTSGALECKEEAMSHLFENMSNIGLTVPCFAKPDGLISFIGDKRDEKVCVGLREDKHWSGHWYHKGFNDIVNYSSFRLEEFEKRLVK